jgi:hypothetical protein
MTRTLFSTNFPPILPLLLHYNWRSGSELKRDEIRVLQNQLEQQRRIISIYEEMENKPIAVVRMPFPRNKTWALVIDHFASFNIFQMLVLSISSKVDSPLTPCVGIYAGFTFS